MPARPRPPSTCSITPAPSTSSAASTRAPPRPTTTPRSRNAASPSTRACVPFQWMGHTVNLIDTPGPRRFHRRGGALACACSTAASAFSTPRRASRRNRKRSGGRRTSTASRGWSSSTRWTSSGRTSPHCLEQIRDRLDGTPLPIVIPIGAGSIKETQHAVRRRHRPARDEGPLLRRRRPRQDGPRRPRSPPRIWTRRRSTASSCSTS